VSQQSRPIPIDRSAPLVTDTTTGENVAELALTEPVWLA
jgi:hypothetical protein